MKTQRAKVTLDNKEVHKAVERYYNSLNTGKICHGNIKVYKTGVNSDQCSASFDVEVEAGIDITKKDIYVASGVYCKLRHRASGLYFNDVVLHSSKNIDILCNYNGREFDTLDDVFAYIRKRVTTYNTSSNIPEGVKERLLQFEVVNYGEKSVEDMTFHVDVLGNA